MWPGSSPRPLVTCFRLHLRLPIPMCWGWEKILNRKRWNRWWFCSWVAILFYHLAAFCISLEKTLIEFWTKALSIYFTWNTSTGTCCAIMRRGTESSCSSFTRAWLKPVEKKNWKPTDWPVGYPALFFREQLRARDKGKSAVQPDKNSVKQFSSEQSGICLLLQGVP